MTRVLAVLAATSAILLCSPAGAQSGWSKMESAPPAGGAAMAPTPVGPAPVGPAPSAPPSRSVKPAAGAAKPAEPPKAPAIDANKDGGIDEKEMRAARAKAFDRMDGNRDGVLERVELEAVRDALMRVWTARHIGSAEQPPPPLDVDYFFKLNDKNRDAKITKAEFLAVVDDRFKTFDRNKDGRITKEEAAAGPPPK